MNNSFKGIILAAIPFFMISCSSEIFNDTDSTADDNDNKTFSAQQELLTDDGDGWESSATTRTTLGADKSISWTLGDAVNIYDGSSSTKYTVSKAAGTACTFVTGGVGVKKSDSYLSAYPYNMATSFADSKISNLTLPANQEATDGGFDPSCNLMVAKYDQPSSTLKFKHVCSYIKLKTAMDCSRIVLTFGDGATPACTFDVAWDANGNPEVDNVSNATNVVRLLGDIKAGVDYYIAVLPGTYNGVTVTLEPKNLTDMIDWENRQIKYSSYHKKTTNTLVMNRAKSKSFGELGKDGETTENIGFVDFYGYANTYGDGNYGTSGKIVLWAKTNIGAGDETNPGEYFAWGEVNKKDAYSYESYLCNDYYPSVLDEAHDAASVNYGRGWRMPTDDEFKILKEENIFVYDSNAKGYYVYPGEGDCKNLQYVEDKNGHLGVYRVPTGMTGDAKEFVAGDSEYEYVKALVDKSKQPEDHMFLPLGGYKYDNSQNGGNIGKQGFYWTNGHGGGELLTGAGERSAYYLGIGTSGDRFNMKSYAKPVYYGFNIRPVFVVEWDNTNSK